MIKCKLFEGYRSDDHFNDFIEQNNISFDQIKDIKYVPTVGTNHNAVHNIFLLYDDAPTVMFDDNLFKNIQQETYKYLNYTGTPN